MNNSQFTNSLPKRRRWRETLSVLVLVSLFSCSPEQGDTFTSESAQQAAQCYYTLYTQGKAKECIEGMADAESFSPEYKEMLQDVFAQGAKELGRKGSVARVEATSDTLYVADSTAYVYLDLVFTDSVHEQVTLPMVFKKGEWRLR